MTPRAQAAVGLLVLLQIAHSVEEYFGRLWESFPPARVVSGLISADLERGFVIFNVLLILFALWCWLWPVRLGWRSATALAWLLVALGLINGIGHPLWSISRGGYTPGVVTAPLILIVATYAASQLLRKETVIKRGRSSVMITFRRKENSIKTILKGAPTPEELFQNDLPLLTPSRNADERAWLESSITTFGRSVASFIPGNYKAYARIYHPFDNGAEGGRDSQTWNDIAASAGVQLDDPETAAQFAYNGVNTGQAPVGRRPQVLVAPLIENLKPLTTTPDHCFFAIWEGFGDSVAHHFTEPTLNLPHRRYHVFEGPIEASRTSFSDASFVHTSANLWWPADRAWFVSTEIDHAWSYVGGSRELIDALLNDIRLDSVETFAAARW